MMVDDVDRTCHNRPNRLQVYVGLCCKEPDRFSLRRPFKGNSITNVKAS